MGIPIDETKDYQRAMNQLADVCRDLAKNYHLTASQTYHHLVDSTRPTSEGPIEFRDANERLIASVSFLLNFELGDDPKVIGIDKVTLSVYRRMWVPQRFISDFRTAYEKCNSDPSAVEIEEIIEALL